MGNKRIQATDSTDFAPSATFKIAVAAIFAALVAAATLLFVVPIPATSGYFNLGETLIYIAALLFGPLVGAIAGAGATIADVLVAAQYAPGTFTIKAIEGFLVGFLNKKLNRKITKPHLERNDSRCHWRIRNGFRILPLRNTRTRISICFGSS